MSIITGQQLARYFEQYASIEVTFNKQVITATGLVTRNVYLKIQDRQVPCVVFSSSMAAAKVVAGVKSPIFAALKQTGNRLTLRWCFKRPEKVEPITFFVTCHATGFTHYSVQDPDVQIITLEYSQRPPDDLIQILGTMLEAKCNSQHRKEERIIITPESMKKFGLESRDALLFVDGTARRCVLRDVSFGGAKVLAPGLAESDLEKQVSLKIAKGEQAMEMTLPGVIKRIEEVGGRKDIVAVSIQYSADPPMTYKLLINSFLTSMRKVCREPEKPPAPGDAITKPAEPAAPPPPAAADGAPSEKGPGPRDG